MNNIIDFTTTSNNDNNNIDETHQKIQSKINNNDNALRTNNKIDVDEKIYNSNRI